MIVNLFHLDSLRKGKKLASLLNGLGWKQINRNNLQKTRNTQLESASCLNAVLILVEVISAISFWHKQLELEQWIMHFVQSCSLYDQLQAIGSQFSSVVLLTFFSWMAQISAGKNSRQMIMILFCGQCLISTVPKGYFAQATANCVTTIAALKERRHIMMILIRYARVSGRVYFQDPSSRTGFEDIGLFSGLVLKINFLYWQSLFSGLVLTDSAGLL